MKKVVIYFNQKDFEASKKNGTADLEALFAGTPNKKVLLHLWMS